ncbi:hypothetical protein QIH93_20920 [Bradyrhizobium ottawaense]|uniref:DUF6950 family protein n=1 Tax=Bradyrhizobium ottawaense TaxID=931866 RepID=UPI002714942F|nr:hypothetical protein [Bradyrhizobium ottawaense]WLB43012.1 hypothetical protein QIH93_20920 [Bradyrhizobium ottawaense]
MRLPEYLDDVAGRDCGYGRLDCAVFMADWLMRCGWPDPMADRRGTYATERAYRAAIRSEGGIVASCRRRFSRMGLREVQKPAEGDLVLVLAPFTLRQGRAPLCRPTGAIALRGGMVALLDWPRGIVGARLPVVAAWSVSHG